MKAFTLSTTAVLISVFGVVAGALGDTDPPPPIPPSSAPRGLQTVPVPEPANLASFVANKEAAIRLGKVVFWDLQVGSDNQTACATCHFHAGADSRSMNQLNPGADKGFRYGPNYHLTADVFPLRKLSDPTDRGSSHTDDVDDVVSSQGVFNMEFDRLDSGAEKFYRPFDPVFSVQGLNVRRVEPRNTPSVINAVFNHRNFWDGRAQNEFNGVNNWGDRDPDARVYRAITSNTPPEAVRLADHANLRLTNASLASQAVAPILSTTEMSAGGRDAMDIGSRFGGARSKKLTQLRPLAIQRVHPEDSVLGPLSAWPNAGLKNVDYPALIRAAFKREWWDSAYVIRVADDGSLTLVSNKRDKSKLEDNEFTLMEYNFALFFGLAVQLYEATLVANDTPYDRWREGTGTISQQAFDGLMVFMSANKILPNGTSLTNEGARCINCHAGPAFTDASVMTVSNPNPLSGTVRRIREGQEIDRGFNNIGVRSTLEDLGVGGKDKFGKPLSATALCRLQGGVGTAESPCPPTPNPLTFVAVDGGFKVPGLRNVELTAPYFHNGGYFTLESVMDFYSRGGDFGCSKNLVTPCGATPGAKPIRAADGTEIAPLGIPAFSAPSHGYPQGLTQQEKDALVAFMKSLTDERVRYRKAPFDHPQLFVPHGQLNDQLTAVQDSKEKGQAQDRVRELPAVGRNGGDPLPGFLQYR